MLSTNMMVDPKDWDGNTVKGDSRLSYLLEQRKAAVRRFLFDLETKGELADLRAEDMKRLVEENLLGNMHDYNDTPNGFCERFKGYGERQKAKSTRELYDYTLKLIKKFVDSYEGDFNRLRFEDIDQKWLRDFDVFLQPSSTSRNARNIHFRNIRAVFNEALDDEIITCYPFRRFKIRPEATLKRSLSVEELRILFDYPVEPYAELYRDMFKLIFMLCGINIVDLYGLTGISKNGRVEYRRAKTHRLYSIKVEPEAMEIIERWKGKAGLLCIADRWIEHKQFGKQMNKALRMIGAKREKKREGRGWEKKIDTGPFPGLTSYWARHSWATIAAELDIPDAVISQALGHAAENRTTEIYIRRNQQKVDEANRKVIDWVLYGKK